MTKLERNDFYGKAYGLLNLLGIDSIHNYSFEFQIVRKTIFMKGTKNMNQPYA